MGVSARQKASRYPQSERERQMFEAFHEILSDPTSHAEIVGGVIEALVFIVPFGIGGILDMAHTAPHDRHGKRPPRTITGHATRG